MKKRCFAFCFAGAALAASAQPTLSGVSVVQDASSRVVTITYALDRPAIVTLDILTNRVSIGADKFRTLVDTTVDGKEWPLNRVVSPGTHRLVWNPSREWPGFTFAKKEFSVDLRAYSLSQPPDYMVLDLTAKHTSERNMRWFYAKAEDLPEGGMKTADPGDADAVAGLTNDVYRTTKLVMRRIPAAGNKWRMGSPVGESSRGSDETAHYVTFTNDYYMAVYETTESQISHADPAVVDTKSCMPAYYQSYNLLRGEYGTAYCWPTNGTAVKDGSKMAIFRARTGLMMDLPTEAQWEYACRAGTEGPYYDGSTSPSAIAWNIYTSEKERRCVGLKSCNAWGMYDMLGNLAEWVLDQYGAYGGDPVVSPVGPADNPGTRIVRGGSNWMGDGASRAAWRRSRKVDQTSDSGYGGGFGYRLCCPAEIPAE